MVGTLYSNPRMSRLLIVDDSFTARTILTRTIGGEHEVRSASGGEAALAALEAGGIDLVLLDLLMPGMDGLTALTEIRRRWPALPVVVVSADIQESTRRQVLEAGARGIVYKPPKREEILAAVAGALGRTSP